MSREIKSEALPEPTELGIWEAPTLTRLDTEDAENDFVGVGTDFGPYAS